MCGHLFFNGVLSQVSKGWGGADTLPFFTYIEFVLFCKLPLSLSPSLPPSLNRHFCKFIVYYYLFHREKEKEREGNFV